MLLLDDFLQFLALRLGQYAGHLALLALDLRFALGRGQDQGICTAGRRVFILIQVLDDNLGEWRL